MEKLKDELAVVKKELLQRSDCGTLNKLFRNKKLANQTYDFESALEDPDCGGLDNSFT